MPRNIVICCDGTNNQFGTNNTNIVRVVQVMEHDSESQLIYYDPGIGTLPEPGFFTRIGKKFSEWWDLAFATSLKRKVGEAYAFLMEHWQPGDRVYLFGFSRGAYTVRVLAGMLHHLGLLPPGNENQIPYLIRLFHGTKGEESKYYELGADYRKMFARVTTDPERRFPVHFVGVFDTVSSVGWIWNQATYRFTAYNPSIANIRHAISLDEHRAFFRQNRFSRVTGQDLGQLWFPGVHSDIGGGYPEGNLWRCAFDWMVDEAENKGLMINAARRSEIAPPIPPNDPQPWASTMHESLTLLWMIGEIVPKHRWNEKTKKYEWRMNLGRHREIKDGELLHSAALWRIRKTDYNPTNLTESFRAKVRALPDVPAQLVYESGTVSAPGAPQ